MLSEIHYHFPRLVGVEDEVVCLPIVNDVVYHRPVYHRSELSLDFLDICMSIPLIKILISVFFKFFI